MRSWLGKVFLVFLFILVITIPQVPIVYGLDDSSVLVSVDDSKFHVDIDLLIQLSIQDYSQFTDAEDAYSQEKRTFKDKLTESIEDGVQDFVEDATIDNLEIEVLDCDESAGKMRVELSFDVEGAITTGTDGKKVYNLEWRSFEADQKFRCASRDIRPSEALGLDFSEFDDDLDDEDEWRIEGSNGNTVIRKKREYDLQADDGEVDLRVTQKFTLPGTNLTINEDTVETAASAETVSEEEPWWQPLIDFLRWLLELMLGLLR
jgi:hypothetical protein